MPATAVPGIAEAFGGPRLVFYALAALVVGGALVTITRKNAISAVMALVATFFGLAALYAMLSAQFLAVIQILVYAGAIMVLFVFVVMVLNRDEVEPWALRGTLTKALGVAAATYLFAKSASFLFSTVAMHPEMPESGFGGVADVGEKLFTSYVFPFEIASLPLLVAVIGAVVVARTPKRVAHEHEGGLSPDTVAPAAAAAGGTPSATTEGHH